MPPRHPPPRPPGPNRPSSLFLLSLRAATPARRRGTPLRGDFCYIQRLLRFAAFVAAKYAAPSAIKRSRTRHSCDPRSTRMRSSGVKAAQRPLDRGGHPLPDPSYLSMARLGPGESHAAIPGH